MGQSTMDLMLSVVDIDGTSDGVAPPLDFGASERAGIFAMMEALGPDQE
jgi:hypothetical protein